MAIVIYGIKNCDTMKKARAWLDAHGVDYRFHDYKAEGHRRARLEKWIGKVGWEPLLNRAGTTFRGLSDADKARIDEKKAIRLMLAHPTPDQAAGAGSQSEGHGRLRARALRGALRLIFQRILRTSFRQISRGTFALAQDARAMIW